MGVVALGYILKKEKKIHKLKKITKISKAKILIFKMIFEKV